MKLPQSNFHWSVYPELEKLAKAISKAMAGSETIDQTSAENDIRVKALRKFGIQKNNKPCLQLADKLENCSPEETCGSMACSSCQRNRRLRFMQNWIPYIKAHQDEYVAVTIVFYADKHSASELNDWEKVSVRSALSKKPLCSISQRYQLTLNMNAVCHDHCCCRPVSLWAVCFNPGCNHSGYEDEYQTYQRLFT